MGPTTSCRAIALDEERLRRRLLLQHDRPDDRLALTVGGRYNYAHIEIKNQRARSRMARRITLTGTARFLSLQSDGRRDLQAASGLTLYGSYAEANRAPTAAELACADPENPCLIESFLTADPPLKQVVSRTFELGLRGQPCLARSRPEAGVDGRRVPHRERGRHHRDRVGIQRPRLLRQRRRDAAPGRRGGHRRIRTARWFAYANYAFIDATFRTANIFSSPDNPDADADVDCAHGEPVTIRMTMTPSASRSTLATACPASRATASRPASTTGSRRSGSSAPTWWRRATRCSSVTRATTMPPLDGYAKVDIRTSYNMTENMQIYGLIDNLFDSRYGLFGAFYNREAARRGGRGRSLARGRRVRHQCAHHHARSADHLLRRPEGKVLIGGTIRRAAAQAARRIRCTTTFIRSRDGCATATVDARQLRRTAAVHS